MGAQQKKTMDKRKDPSKMNVDPLAARELLAVIEAEITNLKDKIFSTPPQTWEEFQQRAGRYKALISLSDKLNKAKQRKEDVDGS